MELLAEAMGASPPRGPVDEMVIKSKNAPGDRDVRRRAVRAGLGRLPGHPVPGARNWPSLGISYERRR